MKHIDFFDGEDCHDLHDSPARRMSRANEIAFKYGGIDGDHHETWVIDQMVRALHGAELVWHENTSSADPARHYSYTTQGTSPEYDLFVLEAKGDYDIDEDGYKEYEYTWEVGIAP